MKYDALPKQFIEWGIQNGWKLETLRRQVLDILQQQNFQYVHPPFVEHYDTLALGAGSLNPDKAFRFNDPVSGKLLGIRTDISPQIARLDAHTTKQQEIQHYCYAGEVTVTHAESLEVRNPYQVGAEIFGDSSNGSDIRTIDLALQCSLALLKKKPQHFLINIGHTGLLKGLLTQTQLTDAQKQDFLYILMTKSVPDLQLFIEQHQPTLTDQGILNFLNKHSICDLQQRHTIEQALKQLNPEPLCVEQWQALCHTMQVIAEKHATLRWHIDLSGLTGYNYHTGFIFSLYYNSQMICRGGRYDNVLNKQRAATGFTLDINNFLRILND